MTNLVGGCSNYRLVRLQRCLRWERISWYCAMDGLIVIRSTKLSYHIARTRLHDGVVASYHRALGERGWDSAITPEEERGLYKPGVGREKWRRSIHKISVQRTPKTIIKYYLEFYLFKITSLIHTQDWAVYACTSIYSSPVRVAEDYREFRQFAFRIGRAPFNPHLLCGFSFLSTRQYRLPGDEVSQHRPSTLGGIFWGVVVRRRSLIFVYIRDGNWPRFDLERLETAALRLAEEEALAQGQEVECQDKTMKERD